MPRWAQYAPIPMAMVPAIHTTQPNKLAVAVGQRSHSGFGPQTAPLSSTLQRMINARGSEIAGNASAARVKRRSGRMATAIAASRMDATAAPAVRKMRLYISIASLLPGEYQEIEIESGRISTPVACLLLSQRLHTGQLLAFKELKARAAAGGDV